MPNDKIMSDKIFFYDHNITEKIIVDSNKKWHTPCINLKERKKEKSIEPGQGHEEVEDNVFLKMKFREKRFRSN